MSVVSQVESPEQTAYYTLIQIVTRADSAEVEAASASDFERESPWQQPIRSACFSPLLKKAHLEDAINSVRSEHIKSIVRACLAYKYA